MKTTYVANKNFNDLVARWTVAVGKRRYVDVFVWKSEEGLYRNTNFSLKPYAGAYVGYSDRKQAGLFGEVHLLRELLEAGYVSHELAHLVFDWMSDREMREFTSGQCLNERMAYLMSDVTREFWNKFYDFFNVVPSADGHIVPADQ